MTPLDTELSTAVTNLYRLSLYGRWLFVAASWLILTPIALWDLRGDIPLWLEYFTWAAVSYSFQFQRLAALLLSFCVAITAAVLVWQSSNIVQGGISPAEKRRLEKRAKLILAAGPRHPLWRLVAPRGR